MATLLQSAFDPVLQAAGGGVRSAMGRFPSKRLTAQFILLAIGSRGDVDPLKAIALELQRRGRSVLLAALPPFAQEARSLGLPTIEAPPQLAFALQPAAARGAFDRLLGRSLGDWSGMRQLFRDRTQWIFDLVRDAHVPGETVVLGRSGLAGARVAREVLDVRLATAHHSPASLRSRTDCHRFAVAGGRGRLRRTAQDVMWRAADGYVGTLLLPELNRFRAQFGLAPVRRLFDRWAPSPDLNLGFFPAWYAPPQPDWPGETRLCGFPVQRPEPQAGLPPDVRDFLARGDPPVVITYGAHEDRGGRLAATAHRLTSAGRFRCLFLGRRAPADQASNEALLYCEFAPLGALLPAARAIVHHGGIGTMAAAIAAGTPQLIVPVVGDQWDQARRAARLGLGRVLPRDQLESRLGEVLAAVSTEPAIRAACAAARERGSHEQGERTAAGWLEALAARPSQLPDALG